MPAGSSHPAKFAAANGKRRIQNARAVLPELIDDQLYASTVRFGPMLISSRRR